MSTTDLSDEQLGRRALAGDHDAFLALFTRHERGLYNVAHRVTGDREEAADIAQEAFLRVFARLDALTGREVNLPAYLHRTARNLALDRARAREAPVDDIAGMAGADATLAADPPLAALIGDDGARVRAANARLPERHRLALALREIEEMGYQDIGRVLDVSPGAVGRLLARARMALRRELRLQHVDLDALPPGCRSRAGDIGALLDGELGADRARVLTDHLATCPDCAAVRASFDDARATYRAWLPLPLIGLGAETARAAQARGLVDFPAARPAGRAAGARGWLAGALGGRRPMARAAAVGTAATALLLCLPTVVAVRSGSQPEPGPPAPAGAITSDADPVAPVAVAPETVTATTPGASPAAPAAAPPPAPVTSAPGDVAAPDPAVGTVRTRIPLRPTPATTTPPAAATTTSGGVAGAPAAPPATGAPAPVEPPAGPTVTVPGDDAPRTDPPPGTVTDPPTRTDTTPTTPTDPPGEL